MEHLERVMNETSNIERPNTNERTLSTKYSKGISQQKTIRDLLGKPNATLIAM